MKCPRSADAACRPYGAALRSGVPHAPPPFPVIPVARDGGRVAARIALTAALGALLSIGAIPDARADDAAVESMLRKSNCLKCHAVDKKKDGPSFKDTAAKYKGKPDAEAKLATFVTTGPKVKIDGKDETHESLKTKSDAEVRDAVRWILSR